MTVSVTLCGARAIIEGAIFDIMKASDAAAAARLHPCLVMNG